MMTKMLKQSFTTYLISYLIILLASCAYDPYSDTPPAVPIQYYYVPYPYAIPDYSPYPSNIPTPSYPPSYAPSPSSERVDSSDGSGCTNCLLRFNADLNDCGQYTQGIQNLEDKDSLMAMCLRNKGYSSIGKPCDNICR
jgi:hypothetical protein